jgi:hypothetical protein
MMPVSLFQQGLDVHHDCFPLWGKTVGAFVGRQEIEQPHESSLEARIRAAEQSQSVPNLLTTL